MNHCCIWASCSNVWYFAIKSWNWLRQTPSRWLTNVTEVLPPFLLIWCPPQNFVSEALLKLWQLLLVHVKRANMNLWQFEVQRQNRSQAAEWPSCPLMATIPEFTGSRFSICGNLASLCGQALFVNWILSCLPKSEQKSFLCGDFSLRFLIDQSWQIFHLLCHRF